MKMTHKPTWIPAEFIPVKTGTGMTEEGHLSFYFRGDKQSFLRKQEYIDLNFHSWGWAKFAHERLLRKPGVVNVLIILLTVFLFTDNVMSDIYTYTDKDGVVHFTNIKPAGKKFKVFLKTPENRKPRPGVIPVPPKDKSPERYTRYNSFIKEASELYAIPESLIKAVIKVESDFDPSVVSVAGARGLMQLLPETAERMKVDDIFDPRQNILGGTKYLRLLANMFEGDILLTIAAYHAGEGNVIKYNGIPPFKTTINYIKNVLKYYVEFSNSI